MTKGKFKAQEYIVKVLNGMALGKMGKMYIFQ